jgi:hypothetical protein
MPNDQKNQGTKRDKSRGMQEDKNKSGKSSGQSSTGSGRQVPAPVLLPVIRETPEIINNEPWRDYDYKSA